MPTEARIQEHRAQLEALLPQGLLWTRRPQSVRERVIAGLAAEGARHEELVLALIEESDPRTTTDLIAEWEAWVGLPDPCFPPGTFTTLEERRAQVVSRLTLIGGQSKQFFIALAAALGFTITITEFTTFQVGLNGAGDPVGGTSWVYSWQVNTPVTPDGAILECLFDRLKPAHTVVHFSYSNLGLLTLSAQGTVAIAGSLSKTLGPLTLSASGIIT